ncbi:MAG TPA: Rieske (2Fe-2S) protein [Steroidobacter sp.]|uniref:aromatic ring-hydroxylating oxygenase subunit alpha n=1 Tax=Steroidobacter sp. TaxID=1978227 RepID=UPI002ED93EF4
MANDAVKAHTVAIDRIRRRHRSPVPHEGDNGLFSQSWFPICLSNEVAQGQVIGRDFLDGRVVVYRGEDGVARVMSAYCPHVGADLSVGAVIGNRLQCAFHRWEYDAEGWCAKTGVGDPPPPTACLFKFPVIERFGIVWVFNGEQPLWDLFDFDTPDEQLAYTAFYADLYTCDGWIFAANTPDIQHIKAVHGIRFLTDDPHAVVQWEPYGFRMKISARHQHDEAIEWNVGIRGSSTYIQEGTVDGWWLGVFAGFSLPRPGAHRPFMAICVHKGDGSPESERQVQERLEFGKQLLSRTAFEDKPILDNIHYTAGTLTRGDLTLGRYIEMLRKYPRAHPSADFIK